MLFPLTLTGLERLSLWIRFLSSPWAGFRVIPIESIVTNNMGVFKTYLWPHRCYWYPNVKLGILRLVCLSYQNLLDCSPATSESSLSHMVINHNSLELEWTLLFTVFNAPIFVNNGTEIQRQAEWLIQWQRASEWQYQDENLVFMDSQSTAPSSSHHGN